MNGPKIMRVDKDIYVSGKRLPNFWSSDKNLKFYGFKCNWTLNPQTQRFYHVLAYSSEQAEEMVIEIYARTHKISKNWVVIS